MPDRTFRRGTRAGRPGKRVRGAGRTRAPHPALGVPTPRAGRSPAAVQDGLDLPAVQRGSAPPGRPPVEGAHLVVDLAAHQRRVLQLLQALGHQVDDLLPEELIVRIALIDAVDPE